MKKLVSIKEVDDDGFGGLMGERVTLFCMNYFYTGKLVGVNDKFVVIEDPAIVYETGAFDKKDWEDCQKLGVKEWRVTIDSIESYGILK